MEIFDLPTGNVVTIFAAPKTGESPARDARLNEITWVILPGGANDALIKAADDGLSAVIVPGLEGGLTNFSVSGTASNGVSITQVFLVNIVEEPAERIELSQGQLTPKA